MSVELTKTQEKAIIELYKINPNINHLTQKVFNSKKLDGRSKEGRAIRQFLAENGLQYKTTKREKRGEIYLKDEQKAFIRENFENMRAMEMAKVIFPKARIESPLTKEVIAIMNYIKISGLKTMTKNGSTITSSYSPPKTIKEAIGKINKYAFQDLNEDELSAQNKRNIESMLKFIRSPRYIQIINSYTDKDNRELMESEFIRYVWDKPDLTNEEITLYVNVCVDIVINKRLLRHVESLNMVFEEALGDTSAGVGVEQNQITIRLSEAIKAKTDEYHKVQQRIEKLLGELNGKRSERLKTMRSRNSNFLALVEAMQEEKERKKLILLSKANRIKAKEEADRLESLPEFKARIFGLSKNEVI